jgi:hypothetical protein
MPVGQMPVVQMPVGQMVFDKKTWNLSAKILRLHNNKSEGIDYKLFTTVNNSK